MELDEKVYCMKYITIVYCYIKLFRYICVVNRFYILSWL